jgi:hypothetical protein
LIIGSFRSLKMTKAIQAHVRMAHPHISGVYWIAALMKVMTVRTNPTGPAHAFNGWSF